MRSGIVGFILGATVVVLAIALAQILVIGISSGRLNYRFNQYVFSDTEFPWGYLEQGRVVRTALFPVRITTTFYDAQYHEVTRAEKPGRYGAVVRIGLNGGVTEWRFITLYRTPGKIFFSDGSSPMTVSAQLPPGTGIDPVVLQNQAPQINEAVRDGFCGDGDNSPDLAVLLAGLSETSPGEPAAIDRTNALARDVNWWFVLRQRLGLPLKYRHLVDLPDGYDADPGKRWPLILYLHGAGQMGDDLGMVRKSGLAGLVAGGRKFPAIVVSPQCSWQDAWVPQALSQLLDEVSAQYRVDPDRIYVTGISAGGDATWGLALAYPERFAAIAPIAGESDPMDAGRIKDIPTWAFQGEKDEVDPASSTIDMVEAVRRAGGHPHLTLFPNGGHDSWDQAYATEALYTWLLAQKRGAPEVMAPGVPGA
ncbi:MAG TPA: PHB depolymerase family esterase [Candidatus Methylacidiphilales bacterium]|jgi:predicted esterase|nr:PHB depolymerase family esterase [Candidatus Methylacidiphilales bacterium]